MDRPWLKFYESSVPPQLHYPPVPLHQLLIESTKKYPNQNAILFYGKGMTYRELDEETNRFAQALQKLGVRKGDRVAVMLPNIPQCVIAYYGALKIGAIVVMTNPLYVERELQIQLADSGAETIVALDFFYPRIEKAKQGTGSQKHHPHLCPRQASLAPQPALSDQSEKRGTVDSR
ncbi:MAG: AMP-binding protein [Candidatus Manganitrophus sp.]|nr:AMP-binding protein [Candidatus Manganitrophus sp.]